MIIPFFIFSSCSSNSDNDGTSVSTTNSIVGKWYIYKNIEGGYTLIGSQICSSYPNCKTYEFKSNGTCIFIEYGYTTAYKYKIDGDFVKFYNPQSDALIETYRIILLTNDELGIDQTDEINYFKRI